jgi:hypothetical protein
MKRILLMFACLFLFASCKQTVENVIAAKLKKEEDAQVPRDMGDGIRLDTVSAKGLSIRYSYTFTEYKEGELNRPVFYKVQKKELLDLARHSEDMTFYRDNKIKMSFAYYFNDGKPISTIIIKPEDYTSNKN